jgi:Xaa-Pro aminopeptidase
MATPEATWYTMMGLSKIFLRNFLIGCFLLLIGSVATLATLLNSSNQERIQSEREHNAEIIKIKKECEEMKELKNDEYIKMLKEAIINQKEIDREIMELRKTYLK